MNKNQQFTYQVITEFLQARLSRQEAAELLNVSPRSVSRIARRVETKGFLGVMHGNRGKVPINRTPDALKGMVMDLVATRYFDCNMTHALELLELEQGIEIKYETFRKWCHEKDLVKSRHKRRSKPRHYRLRLPSEGMMLQFDGSPHRYNGKDEWCLIAAIDDATSEIPYGEFFHSEDTLSCMQVMKRIIELKGIPQSLYVDHAGWFGGGKRQHFSQFKRACEELGIRILFAHSPESKGRIERAWRTIQDRLMPEMRMRNIHRMPAANSYLQEQFLPNYWNQRNRTTPRSLESKYRPLPTSVDLKEIFCLKESRCVKSDHTLSWNNQIYSLTSPLKYSIRGQKIEFRTYLDLTWQSYFAGKPIELTPLPAQSLDSKSLRKAA